VLAHRQSERPRKRTTVMKSVQVRKNTATKPTINQSRNGHARAAQEFALPPGKVSPVCLCFYNRHKKKPLIEVPFTAEEYLHFVRSDCIPVFGLGRFVREAVLEKLARLKGLEPATPAPAPTAQTASGAARLPDREMFIPSKLALEAADALGLYMGKSKAARAWAAMAAEEIKCSVQANAGWERFDQPGFGEGSEALARELAFNLYMAESKLEQAVRPIIAALNSINDPVDLSAGFSPGLKCNLDPGSAVLELEEASKAVSRLIYLQGYTLENCKLDEESFQACYAVRELFAPACAEAIEAVGKLTRAYFALVAAGRLN
jgi:hypothetical protein